MKRRKHKVVVELTFNRNVLEQTAVDAVRTVLSRLDWEQSIGDYAGPDDLNNLYVQNVETKSFIRVCQAPLKVDPDSEASRDKLLRKVEEARNHLTEVISYMDYGLPRG